MYPIAAKPAGATPVAVPERDLRADVDALLAPVTPRTRIVFLANPNNPTGTLLPAAEVRRLRKRPARRRAAGHRRRLRRIRRRRRLRGRRRPGRATRQRRHAAHLLEDLRPGGAAPRLGLLPGRRSPTCSTALRGPFNVSAPAQAAGVAALADQRSSWQGAGRTTTAGCPGWRRSSTASSACSRCRAPATSSSCAFPRSGATPTGGRRLPQGRGIIAAQDGRLWPARLPAHHHRTGRRDAGRASRRWPTSPAARRRRRAGARDHGRQPLFERVALIGIGLIGSSLARVVRRDGLAGHIAGCARSAARPATRRWRCGSSTAPRPSRAPAVDGADLVVLCTPLGAYAEIGARHRAQPASRAPSSPTSARSSSRVIRDLGPHAARRRAFRSRPSRRRHRAFRAGGRLRRAVPGPLVHPDAAARHRCRRRSRSWRSCGGAPAAGRDHGGRPSRPGAGDHLAPAAPDRLHASSAPRPTWRRRPRAR